ncbi:sigma factor-like helix-turn-helix DNA-binding protein, partial [Candidatus Hydrogenedentota bacterium]
EVTWDDLQNLVDEAIADLPEKLREPLVRHFLGKQSHATIASDLGVSRAAVTQRIGRGIGRIRKSLRQRGVPVAITALAAMLAAHTSEAAPVGLTNALAKLAISGMKGPLSTGISAATLGGGSKSVLIGGAVVMWKNILLGAGAVALILAVLYVGKSQSGRSDAPEEKQPVVAVIPVEALPVARPLVEGNEGKAAQPVKTPGEQLDEPSAQEGPTQEELNNVLGKALEALFKRAEDEQLKDGETKLKPYGSDDIPLDNGIHYFLLATELYPEVDGDWLNAKWKEIVANGWIEDPALRALFDECRDAFKAIREGLEVGNAELPPLRRLDDEIHYCPKFRALARIMAMEAQMYAADGDYEAAFDDCSTLMEFANESSRGGVIISGLVGFAMAGYATDPLLDTIGEGQAGAQEYRHLIERVQEIDDRLYTASEMVSKDNESLAACLENALSDGKDLKKLILDTTSDPNNEMHNLFAIMTTAEIEDMFRQTMEDYQKSLDSYFSLPFYEAQAVDLNDLIGDNPISWQLLPAIENVKLNETKAHARARGTMVAAAIELYRVENDSPPPFLEALVPDYISSLPEDPFSGDSFAYSPTDSGYVLYSTGPDMCDDGGQDGGDMVFHR